MPTYVYKFIETGETIEVQQAFTDDALTEAVHPATGATMAVKKVFTPVGVTFKGDGFYKTDSRSGSSSTTKPSASGDGAGSSSAPSHQAGSASDSSSSDGSSSSSASSASSATTSSTSTS